jgi:hypothetical protein
MVAAMAGWSHSELASDLNCLGHYAFTASQPDRGLRPLRDPGAGDEPDPGSWEAAPCPSLV